jgi:hypothetical protein
MGRYVGGGLLIHTRMPRILARLVRPAPRASV